MPRIAHLGAALMAVAVFSVGCSGSGGTRAVPAAPDARGGDTTRAVVAPSPTPSPAPQSFFRMAPLRLVNDPPARFEYAYEAETVCLYGPANPDIDNDNDNDLVAPNKRGPVVAPQRDRVLTVGEFSLPTSCASPSPTPTPSPSPTPTGRLTRAVSRSADAAVAKVKQYYVIRIDLADRSKTIAAGPASNVNDVLNFAAQATPLTLTAGHRYVFALAYALVVPVPSPSPSPTPAPTDSPTPVPSDTPCPGAIDSPAGTFCSWAVPHPPVDLFNGTPYLCTAARRAACSARCSPTTSPRRRPCPARRTRSRSARSAR
jgi:hypothetical protein